MTGIEHAILATACLAVFYYVGKWNGKKEKVEHIIDHTLNMLEKNNMIKVKVDKKTGEKEILPLDKYQKVW
jgi:RNA-binding protein YhbY